MKDVQKTIQFLQKAATRLSAVALNHRIASKIFESQGFSKLAKKYAEHAASELGFVEQFYERILDLDGEIQQEAAPAEAVPHDVEAYFQYDLQVSLDGVPQIEVAINSGIFDLTTLELMKEYYQDEEEDLNWTKAQLDLIQAIGKQNYLVNQL